MFQKITTTLSILFLAIGASAQTSPSHQSTVVYSQQIGLPARYDLALNDEISNQLYALPIAEVEERSPCGGESGGTCELIGHSKSFLSAEDGSSVLHCFRPLQNAPLCTLQFPEHSLRIQGSMASDSLGRRASGILFGILGAMPLEASDGTTIHCGTDASGPVCNVRFQNLLTYFVSATTQPTPYQVTGSKRFLTSLAGTDADQLYQLLDVVPFSRNTYTLEKELLLPSGGTLECHQYPTTPQTFCEIITLVPNSVSITLPIDFTVPYSTQDSALISKSLRKSFTAGKTPLNRVQLACATERSCYIRLY